MNAEHSTVYPGVQLGKNVRIESHAVIGKPLHNSRGTVMPTLIGDNAFIRSHTVIYEGNKIDSDFQTGHHAVIGPGNDIGTQCSVGTNSHLKGFSRMMNGSRVHGLVVMGAMTTLEERSWIGPGAFIDSLYEGDGAPAHFESTTVIGRDAILGCHAYIHPGLVIGSRACIAARINVLKNITPYQLVVGKSAKSIRNITKLTCPFELIDRPYEPDELEVEAENESRFKEQLNHAEARNASLRNWCIPNLLKTFMGPKS